MLSPYRVVDLSDERGQLCGYVLGALGAEVVAVEPPGGSPARRLGPFVDDVADPEHSLTHFAYNRGKRSVVLDLDTEAGRRDLRRLLAASDVLIDSEPPGRTAALGLDPAELAADFPHLVHASITAFGRSGPKADWAATDLIVLAASGTLLLTGDDDRPPVRVSVPQGFHFGAASAACGVVAALIERGRSGRGQHVDAAAQRTAMLATQASILSTGVGAQDVSRSAGGAVAGGLRLRFVYPASDGYVSITHVFGEPIGHNTRRLMEWAHEEGCCDEVMRDKDWVGYLGLIESGEETIDDWERAKAAVEALTSSKTKDELLAGAIERRLLVAPISTPADVLASDQFAAREFFEAVEHRPTGRTIASPAAFARCSATPLRPLGPAPLVGEHTDDVLSGPLEPRPAPPAAAAAPVGDDLPLDGLKVLDFTWAIAGPHAVRLLADLGATVVKIESARRQDGARGYRPVHDEVAGIENSALFDTLAAGKRSLGLDMSNPAAIDVVRDLVRWCDVVIESYTPRAMAKWGLDYEHLRLLKPDVVMLSTCLAGQTGPLAQFAGYGNLGAAFAGFYGLAGWPDRPPAGPFGAYTDYTSTHVIAATLLAAVDHHRRTGEGQHIDLAQSEAAQLFLAPALLDCSANGRVAERHGNRDAHMSPHGVYPTAGSDSWVAIACQDDDRWAALAEVMDRADLACDPELATAPGRVARADDVDAAVAAWSAGRDGHELVTLLQHRRVAAHVVATGADCLADPQLAHAGHFVHLDHPDRACLVENTRFGLSRTPARVSTRAPCIGEHTWEVLADLLGYDDDHIADVAATGALE